MTVLDIIVIGTAVCGGIRALGDATAKVIRAIKKGTEEPAITIEEVTTTRNEVLEESDKPEESNEEEEP